MDITWEDKYTCSLLANFLLWKEKWWTLFCGNKWEITFFTFLGKKWYFFPSFFSRHGYITVNKTTNWKLWTNHLFWWKTPVSWKKSFYIEHIFSAVKSLIVSASKKHRETFFWFFCSLMENTCFLEEENFYNTTNWEQISKKGNICCKSTKLFCSDLVEHHFWWKTPVSWI